MKKILYLALVLTVGVSYAALAMGSQEPKKDTAGAMMKADDTMDATAYDLTGLGKQVVAFTTESAAQMLAKDQTVVYFFAATWCPDCQATYKDIQAHFGQIPPNVTLVFVNYDKAGDLKTKYGVTMQHTFVVVGADGMKKTVWSGTTTVADIVAKATMKAM